MVSCPVKALAVCYRVTCHIVGILSLTVSHVWRVRFSRALLQTQSFPCPNSPIPIPRPTPYPTGSDSVPSGPTPVPSLDHDPRGTPCPTRGPTRDPPLKPARGQHRVRPVGYGHGLGTGRPGGCRPLCWQSLGPSAPGGRYSRRAPERDTSQTQHRYRAGRERGASGSRAVSGGGGGSGGGAHTPARDGGRSRYLIVTGGRLDTQRKARGREEASSAQAGTRRQMTK